MTYRPDIKELRKNAKRESQRDIIALCDYAEELETRLERAASRYTLAEEHLQSLCDKAESDDKCLLCGEDFSDKSGRNLPECPVPSARDYLANPGPLADSITRAAFRKDEEDS